MANDGNAGFHILQTQSVHEDVQRGWMWQLSIPTLNTIVKDVEGTGLQTRIKNATIPGSDVDVIELKYMGTSQFFPGMRKPTTEWSSSFVDTEDHYVHSAINSWLTLIQQIDQTQANAGHSLMASKTNGYALSVFMNLFTYDGVLSREIHFFNTWPKSIGAVDLNYDSSGAVEYTVGWKCDNYNVKS
jgi:hypothetical protein